MLSEMSESLSRRAGAVLNTSISRRVWPTSRSLSHSSSRLQLSATKRTRGTPLPTE